MSSSAERSNKEATDCHRVTWFAPERPVEGNTLYALDGPVETCQGDRMADDERACQQ